MSRSDHRTLRSAFGSFMTGATVVTSRTNEGDHLMFIGRVEAFTHRDSRALAMPAARFST